MVTTLLAHPIVIVSLQGEYDITRRDELVAQLRTIPTCDVAIIDMREVTHLDVSAFTCLTQSESACVRAVREMSESPV